MFPSRLVYVFVVGILSFLAPVATAQAPELALVPPAYEPLSLSPQQRQSIERGAADLGGAVEQSLLSSTLYVVSAATGITSVATLGVLLGELAPKSYGGWGPAAWAALGTVVGAGVVHIVTTPLAIALGLEARRRSRRAREELLLVRLTPTGASLSVSF
jgi:hypothetical protein